MLRYLMAYPKKNFSYPGPSMWFSNRINWIISDVQAKKFFLIIFLASNKVLAMLGSWIGTCSVFFHSYSVSPGVYRLSRINALPINQPYLPKDQSVQFSWKDFESAILIFFSKKEYFFGFIPMKISPNLYGGMDGSQFWCFPCYA